MEIDLDIEPDSCAACGSPNISFDPADGWGCADCGRNDADET